MEPGIVVTVILPGALSGAVQHTTKQVGRVDVSPIGSKIPEWMTRKILHTDRPTLTCARVVPISGEVVTSWVRGDNPWWVRPQVWKKLNIKQRIESYLVKFDEGYGVSYE